MALPARANLSPSVAALDAPLPTAADRVAHALNFIAVRDFALETFGEPVWTRMLGQLGEADRAEWSRSLAAHGVHRLGVLKRGTWALADLVGHERDALVSACAARRADTSKGRIGRILRRFSSPLRAIDRLPETWNRSFTVGEVRIAVRRAGNARVVFETPGMFMDWLRPDCLGSLGRSLELSGARAVTVTEVGRSTVGGDPASDRWTTTVQARWDDADD